MAVKEFLARCIAFYNRIPIDSLNIPNSKAMHLGKNFLAAIFSVIVYSSENLLKTAASNFIYIITVLQSTARFITFSPINSCIFSGSCIVK